MAARRSACLLLVCLFGLAGFAGLAGQALANPSPAEPIWFAVPPVAPPGMLISLVFSNMSTETIQIANSGPWWIEDSTGATVRTAGLVLEAFFSIPPGGTWAWPWDQKDNDGEQVPAGSYTAWIGWIDSQGNGHTASAPIEILGGVYWTVSPDPVAEGSMLNLKLTNATTEEISLDNLAPWWITDEAGNTVFVPFNSPAINAVPPGGTRQWNWDLRDHAGNTIPPGNYVAKVTYRNADRSVQMEAEDPFTIVPAPSGLVVWEVTPRVNSTKSSILMTLSNATPDTIWLRNSAPWKIYDAVGTYVSSAGLAFQAIWPIPPGGTLAWTWDERYASTGEYVPPGAYEARISYALSRESTDMIELSRSFQLIEAGCEFITSPSYIYWEGETIDFEFTNCLLETIAMPCSQAWWITTAWGQPVYWPYVFWAWTFWPPQGGFEFEWPDQTMYNQMPAPPGEYFAWAYFTDERMVRRYVVCSLPITILSLADVEEQGERADPIGLEVRPNPPGPAATVRFRIGDVPTPIEIMIEDVTGRVMVKRAIGALGAGTHEIPWPERDEAGRRLPAGAYFCVLRAGDRTVAEKIVLLR
jgi:flagellar hook assembly protein FlgD